MSIHPKPTFNQTHNLAAYNSDFIPILCPANTSLCYHANKSNGESTQSLTLPTKSVPVKIKFGCPFHALLLPSIFSMLLIFYHLIFYRLQADWRYKQHVISDAIKAMYQCSKLLQVLYPAWI